MRPEKIKTPRGVAVYPALQRPDTRFNENGTYKADLRLDPKDPAVKAFLAKVDALYKGHMGKAHPKNADASNKNAVWYAEADKETGEPTGFVVVKLRVKNQVSKKTGDLWDRRPLQFDARGHPINEAKAIGGGSVLIVTAEPYTWINGATRGVSLQPLAVQIIELREWNRDQAASDFGFGEEEGYEIGGGSQYGIEDTEGASASEGSPDY